MKKKFTLLLLLVTIVINAQCWKTIANGYHHSIGIKSDGTLWTWGNNASGQLGDGTLVDKRIPVQLGVDADWETVCAAGLGSFAVKTNGTLWAWGYNVNGTLGTGTTNSVLTPMQVGTDTNWKTITGSYYVTFGIKTDGTLWGWGINSYGQLGNGTTTPSLVPVQIGLDTDWKSIAGNTDVTFGLKNDGKLYGWGKPDYGQFNSGSIPNVSLVPIRIGVDSDWNSIAAGEFHIMALKNTGTLWGWGSNFYGQVGAYPFQAQFSSPVKITDASNWVSVFAGFTDSFAIKSDGTLWAWGRNQFGELGGGVNYTIHFPMLIGTDTDWQFITNGFRHTLGLKANGDLWAIGTNTFGMFGNGTLNNSFAPIAVDCNPVLSTPEVLAKDDLKMYPNPVKGYFKLESDTTLDVLSVAVYNSLGQLVKTDQSSGNHQTFDVSELNTGIYFLKIKTSLGMINRTFVKE